MAAVAQLQQFVDRALGRDNRACYLVVDDRLRVREIAGEAEHYGLGGLRRGDSAADALLYLQGATETAESHRKLEFLQTPSGRHAHVHVLRFIGGWGLAYLDASREHARRQQQQQAANELALLQQRQQKLLGELEQANRLKGLFMARMSHEFRTPLASVLGYADLLAETLADRPGAMRQLGAVRRGANHLLNLVENLLDQARLEQDELPLRPRVCDPQALIEDLDELFRPIADQKGLALSWWSGPDLPAHLWLDELRLRQILINLLGNALKFTRRGSVTVELDWDDGRLQGRVVDTGPGIEPGLAARLFEPFRQGDTGKGAGLGLAISRALARRMGGDLVLESIPGQGSTLAFEVLAEARRGAAAAPAASGKAAAVAGRQLLIVDDDEDLLALLQNLLQGAGARVRTARSGAEALAVAAQGGIELALVDLQLDGESGAGLVARLREAGCAGPVLLMSAAPPGDGERPAGVGFVAKPVRRADLLARVAAALQAPL